MPKSKLDQFSDEERKVGKCRACMACRRRNREAGLNMSQPKNLYCMDCYEAFRGQPFVSEVRFCRGCEASMTDRYHYCRECKKEDADVADFSGIRLHLNPRKGA